MRFPSKSCLIAVLAGAALVPAGAARAQVSMQFHFGEDDYHRIDGQHPLRGRQYQTMASLAHMLDENAQELSRTAYRAARQERSREHWRVLASMSDFARRTADFHNRMDGYLTSPWDIRREVTDLTRRAQQVNQSLVTANLYPDTYEMWNAEMDLLHRMQEVLHGREVDVPPAHERDQDRDWWQHRNEEERRNNDERRENPQR